EIYQRAAKSHANEASVFNDMGLCYRQVGKLDEAIAAQQQAVELQPGRKLYRNNLATTLVRAGRGNEALDQLLAVHRPPTAHYNIGYLLNEQGDRDAARFHFQRALEFDPTFAPAQQWLAVLPPPAAAPPQAHPGYGQPAPRPQIAAQPAPRMDERVAARPAPPAVAAAEPPAASTFPPQSAGPPIAAAARQPAPNSAPPIAHLPPQNSPPTAAPAHPAMSNQRPLAPPAAQPGAAQQELPRVVSSRPVVVAQEYFEGPEVVSAAERPQPPPQSPSAPLQTPNGFVQGPAIQAAPGAPAAGYYPATGPLPDSRVGAGGASSARRIQNPAAVDEDEAEPDLDAPLPTATRPVGEYRAPSRY
ncbi:MAG: tetratricopeptide repeat protein, partial [Pirellulales bacterium]